MKKQAIQPKELYNRQTALTNKTPTFKPGKSPQCKLGDNLLNANLPWAVILEELIASEHHTLNSLSSDLEVTVDTFHRVLKNDLSRLDFKTGAKLLREHWVIYGEAH